MDKWQAFLEQIEKRLLEKGLKAAAASRLAVGNPFFIYNLRKGHKPSIENLERLCKVLELDYALGGKEAKSDKTPPSFYTFEDGVEVAPELESGRGLRIEEALAALAEHYEKNNEYGRQHFIKEIKGRWPELFRAGRAAEPGCCMAGLGGSAGSKER